MVFVTCQYCGNRQSTGGRWTFTCNDCSRKQPIILQKDKPNATKEIEESQSPEPEKKIVDVVDDNGRKTAEIEVDENVLEIPEAPEEPEENSANEYPTEEFHCPTCNALVNKFEDCANPECPEIIWQG